MYTVDDRDRVVSLPEVPLSSAGVPDPIVLAEEGRLVLSYEVADEDAYAFVRFQLPRLHFFGSPNDEALHGHPLWGRGLGFYGAFRVEHSSLIRALMRRNEVHSRHHPKLFADLNHYILTFHDSTFECVAVGYRVTVASIPADGRVAHMRTLLESR